MILESNKGTPIKKIIHPFSCFSYGSWLDLISGQKKDCIQTRDILSVTLATAHQYLSSLISSVFDTSSNPVWIEFLELKFYDKILGIFELNNPNIQIYSPLHQYFETLAKKKEVFMKVQPILGPLVTAIKNKHGEEIPSFQGHGLFKLHSCINHSCSPNAKQTSREEISNAQIAIVASCDIQKGEEICISYVDVNQRHELRRNEILVNYGFECHCSLCNKTVFL